MITSIVCSQSAPWRSAAATGKNHAEYWLTGDDDRAPVVKSVIQTGCANGDVMRVEGYVTYRVGQDRCHGAHAQEFLPLTADGQPLMLGKCHREKSRRTIEEQKRVVFLGSKTVGWVCSLGTGEP